MSMTCVCLLDRARKKLERIRKQLKGILETQSLHPDSHQPLAYSNFDYFYSWKRMQIKERSANAMIMQNKYIHELKYQRKIIQALLLTHWFIHTITILSPVFQHVTIPRSLNLLIPDNDLEEPSKILRWNVTSTVVVEWNKSTLLLVLLPSLSSTDGH